LFCSPEALRAGRTGCTEDRGESDAPEALARSPEERPPGQNSEPDVGAASEGLLERLDVIAVQIDKSRGAGGRVRRSEEALGNHHPEGEGTDSGRETATECPRWHGCDLPRDGHVVVAARYRLRRL